MNFDHHLESFFLQLPSISLLTTRRIDLLASTLKEVEKRGVESL